MKFSGKPSRGSMPFALGTLTVMALMIFTCASRLAFPTGFTGIAETGLVNDLGVQ